jgi:phosphoribosyl 1,2-cyclic phosphodiesterase
MQVKFYGTRGSIAVSGNEYARFGGSTSCVQVSLDDGSTIIFDAGTGIRRLGDELLRANKTENLAIVLSHTHWDHIQGFPFFAPAYTPDTQITIGICGQDRFSKGDLRSIFAAQMDDKYFPVPLEKMGAEFNFVQPDASAMTSSFGDKWTFYKHNHPGGAYSYRLEAGGKSVVYCTDIEHGDKIDDSIVDFASGADLLIHEGQYTPEELVDKRGWGHSSWAQAVEVAQKADVKKLAITHHDPSHDDACLTGIEKECQQRLSEALLAREGLELTL